jgi:nucleoid-associated protein YgaU
MRSTTISRCAARGLLVSLLTLLGLGATVLPASAQAEEAAAAPEAHYPDSGQVIVRQGDTLYSIARRTLGDGSRYVEIFTINRGLPQADGGTLTDPGVLHVGWRLELPVEDPPSGGGGGGGGGGTDEPDPDDSQGSGETYTVRAGDTLSGIAASQLGNASRYNEIFVLNQGRPQVGGGALTDPGRLTVGWVLELPEASGGGGGTTPPPSGGGRRHTVVAGDSLSSIAQARLGSAARYQEIFELNEGVPQAVGGSLTDPSVLRVGWVLRLPPRGGGGGGTTPDGPDTYREYTVVAGDSLSSIAADELGSAARYQEIYDLNVGRAQAVGGSLSNPSQLRVGWVLRLPVE